MACLSVELSWPSDEAATKKLCSEIKLEFTSLDEMFLMDKNTFELFLIQKATLRIFLTLHSELFNNRIGRAHEIIKKVHLMKSYESCCIFGPAFGCSGF